MSAACGYESCFARLLQISRQEARSLVCYLLALHDIGKFAKKFQAKVSGLYPDCFNGQPANVVTGYDHGAGGLRLFNADTAAFRLPENTSASNWRPLISAVAGHHGAPPDFDLGEEFVLVRRDFGAEGIRAAREFLHKLHALLVPPAELPMLNALRVKLASHILAGLAVLADWIGSNEKWFPYQDPKHELDSYWPLAKGRARRAVMDAGVLPSPAATAVGYSELIAYNATPSPMQVWSRDVRLPDGPGLFIIEDETGSGKTEAAIMLAYRLMAAGSADGLYVALPTMATANAMFDRLADAYRLLFAKDTTPSIALAHGARDMHDRFRAAMAWRNKGEDSYSGMSTGNASDVTASAACAQWIADDRRRAFLADAGAGTIDQALLSVLPSRHQSLRLLGLTRRVLILDEVHAYDAYMHREMERLLEFQAGLGGSAILLSATLPQSARRRLTDAFAKGLGVDTDTHTAIGETIQPYPLATICTASAVSCTGVSGQTGRARTLPVRFISSFESALEEVEVASRSGKAVLYIRNTVDDALEAYEALAVRNHEVTLFHARFALIDRLNRERQIIDAFGKHSTTDQRRGRVLIATQVVEQSLDLDFDALVTDLAPIDLLIQRAGRLWRHHRPGREGRPELLVMGPEPADAPDEDWFRRVFPRSQYVYRDHARLWLTARTLKKTKAIVSPEGLRPLIEAVYGESASDSVPSGLTDRLWEAEGREGADRSIANTNLLKVSSGYLRDAGAWDSDIRTPTRLDDDPHVTLRLGLLTKGQVQPYALSAAPDQLWRAWRLSEISVPERKINREFISDDLKAAVNAAKSSWTRFDAEKILVVLDETDASTHSHFGWAASGRQSKEKVRLGYTPHAGLGYART